MNCLFAQSNFLAGSASTKLNTKWRGYYYYYERLCCKSIVLNKIQLRAHRPRQLYYLQKQTKKTTKVKATNKISIR